MALSLEIKRMLTAATRIVVVRARDHCFRTRGLASIILIIRDDMIGRVCNLVKDTSGLAWVGIAW